MKICLFSENFRIFYCTSRLSLAKMAKFVYKNPISGKLSIANYLKQNVIFYQSHLTIENNLKVEKR